MRCSEHGIVAGSTVGVKVSGSKPMFREIEWGRRLELKYQVKIG